MDALQQHLKIKIVVVLLAIFIWFFVKTENNYKYSFHVPVQVTNLSPKKIIINDIPKKTNVTFWGTGRELLSLILNRKLYYNLDLLDIEKSRIVIPNIHNIRLPNESTIEILNILEPDSIDIQIADLENVAIPIYPNISIETIPGYTIVDGIQLSQDSVLLIGPKFSLDSIHIVETESLNFKKVKHDIHRTINLIPPEQSFVTLMTKEISFYANIQKLMEKRLVEVHVDVANKPKGYETIVIPSSLSLTLIGGVDVLLPIKNSDIKAYVDYQKVKLSKKKEHLAYIDKIEGVRFTDIKPKKFKVIVKKIR